MLDVRDRTDLTLLRRYRRTRDPVVHDRLVRRLRPLVLYLARPYADRGEPFEDVVQVGMLGLLHAIERFDPDAGYRFSTYARPTITGEIKRSFRDTTWRLHVPRAMQERLLRVRGCEARLEVRLRRVATETEVAAETGLSPTAVREARAAAIAALPGSLDEATDAPGALREPGRTDPGYDLCDDGDAVRHAAAGLDAAQRRLLWMRHGEGRLQRDIAEDLGVSQVQVSRLLRAAEQRLRDRASDALDETHDPAVAA